MKKIIAGIIAIVCGLTLNAFTLPSTQVSKNATADPQLVWYQVQDWIYIDINYPINPTNPMTKSQFLDTFAGVCSGTGIECARGFYPEELPFYDTQEGCMSVEKSFN